MAREFIKRMLPQTLLASRQFHKVNGRWPTLRHPRTYQDKIFWLKLFGHRPLLTTISDKLAVRDYVADKVSADFLIPLLFSTADPEDIRPENIAAERFVAKATHDCGGVVLCRDRATFDWAACRRNLAAWLARNYYFVSYEKHYLNIPPRIIVEDLIMRDDGGEPNDYKIYCFHGEPCMIHVDVDRHSDHRQAYFDLDWTPMPVHRMFRPVLGDMPRPARLDEMIRIARLLSEDFVFARVDIYEAGGKLWFGEITLTPDAGLYRFEPPDFETLLGDKLDLARLRKD